MKLKKAFNTEDTETTESRGEEKRERRKKKAKKEESEERIARRRIARRRIARRKKKAERRENMSYTVAKGNQRVDPDQVRETECAPAHVIDLRSDTVTRPTAEMRRAMAEAEVGDDVYGEDPTVNRLEKRAAEMFGKEAALFVPTGCMGNLIAIKVWTHHGNEVICEERSHANLPKDVRRGNEAGGSDRGGRAGCLGKVAGAAAHRS